MRKKIIIIIIILLIIKQNNLFCFEDKIKHFFCSIIISTIAKNATNDKRTGIFVFFTISSKEFFDETGFSWGDILANLAGCLIGSNIG